MSKFWKRIIGIRYRTPKGTILAKTVLPKSLSFKRLETKGKEQWVLRVWDCGEQKDVDYPVKDIRFD